MSPIRRNEDGTDRPGPPSNQRGLNTGDKRRRSKLTSVDGILKSALSQFGLDDRVRKYEFVRNWPDIVGIQAAERCRPAYIRGQTLHVEVDDSVWAQELSFEKALILDRLNGLRKNHSALKEVAFQVKGRTR